MNLQLPSKKIVTLNELSQICERLRRQGQRVVLCHGCFDFLHLGHLRHFKEARLQGDVLLVTVTQDRHINKGPGRPFYSADDRAEMLAALEIVDYTCINPWPTAAETIETLRPDIFVKGIEYSAGAAQQDARFLREAEAVRTAGGQIHFTSDITFSSSKIIDELEGEPA